MKTAKRPDPKPLGDPIGQGLDDFMISLENRLSNSCLFLLSILIAIIVFAIFFVALVIFFDTADAASAPSNVIHLPLVMNNTPKEQFVIDRVDCPYVLIKYVNPSLQIDKSYYAGMLSVDKLGGGDLGFTTVHWWYDQGNTVWYWASYDFDIWGYYFLDAWVKVPGGYVWVSNGDLLWYPCPPH